MTSKQRVLNAVNHKTTDRLPYDFWAEQPVTERLIKELKLPFHTDELRSHFKTDLRYVGAPMTKFILKPDAGGYYTDPWGVGFKRVYFQNGYQDTAVVNPLAKAETAKDVYNHSWPDPKDYDFGGVAGYCEKYKDFALIGGNGHFFCSIADMRGYEQFLIDLYEENEIAHAMMEKMCEYWLSYNEQLFEASGGKLDILYLADDYSSQNGLLFSPECYNATIRPYMQRLMNQGKRMGCKIFFHSCGAVRKLIPSLIDMGVDILNPIQIRAAGMNPVELAAEYGKDLCFHGGVDLQQTLSFGSPQDVKKEIIMLKETLGKHGGYIVCSGHTITPDVPIENIYAIYETNV